MLKERKGSNLPINTSAILVLIVMFLALIFGIVNTVMEKETDKLLNLSEKHSPDPQNTQYNLENFKNRQIKDVRLSKTPRRNFQLNTDIKT